MRVSSYENDWGSRKGAKALSNTLSLRISLRPCAFAGICISLAKLEIDLWHTDPNDRLTSLNVLESHPSTRLEGEIIKCHIPNL